MTTIFEKIKDFFTPKPPLSPQNPIRIGRFSVFYTTERIDEKGRPLNEKNEPMVFRVGEGLTPEQKIKAEGVVKGISEKTIKLQESLRKQGLNVGGPLEIDNPVQLGFFKLPRNRLTEFLRFLAPGTPPKEQAQRVYDRLIQEGVDEKTATEKAGEVFRGRVDLAGLNEKQQSALTDELIKTTAEFATEAAIDIFPAGTIRKAASRKLIQELAQKFGGRKAIEILDKGGVELAEQALREGGEKIVRKKGISIPRVIATEPLKKELEDIAQSTLRRLPEKVDDFLNTVSFEVNQVAQKTLGKVLAKDELKDVLGRIADLDAFQIKPRFQLSRQELDELSSMFLRLQGAGRKISRQIPLGFEKGADFPQWVPENLRDKKIIDGFLEKLFSRQVNKFTPEERALFRAIQNEIARTFNLEKKIVKADFIRENLSRTPSGRFLQEARQVFQKDTQKALIQTRDQINKELAQLKKQIRGVKGGAVRIIRERIRDLQELKDILNASIQSKPPKGVDPEMWRALSPRVREELGRVDPRKATRSQIALIQLLRKDQNVSTQSLREMAQALTGKGRISRLSKQDASVLIDHLKSRKIRSLLSPDDITVWDGKSYKLTFSDKLKKELGLSDVQVGFIQKLGSIGNDKIPEEIGLKLFADQVLRVLLSFSRLEYTLPAVYDVIERAGTAFRREALDWIGRSGKVRNVFRENKIAPLSESDLKIARILDGAPREGDLEKITQEEINVINALADFLDDFFKRLESLGFIEPEQRVERYFPRTDKKSLRRVVEVYRNQWAKPSRNVFFGSLLERKADLPVEEASAYWTIRDYIRRALRKIHLEPAAKEAQEILDKEKSAVKKLIGENYLNFWLYKTPPNDWVAEASALVTRGFASSVLGLITAVKNLGWSAQLGMAELGPYWFKGTTEFLTNPRKVLRELADNGLIREGIFDITGAFATREDVVLVLDEGIRGLKDSLARIASQERGAMLFLRLGQQIYGMATELGLSPQIVSEVVGRGLMWGGAKRKAIDLGLKGEDVFIYARRAIKRTHPGGGREEILPAFTGRYGRVLGQFLQTKIKVLDYLLNKALEGDYAAIARWAISGAIIGTGLSTLFGEREYISRKTGKRYSAAVIEPLEFLDPLDFRYAYIGMELGLVTGLQQLGGSFFTPGVSFGLHALGARTPNDAVFNRFRSQGELLAEDLKNLIPSRRVLRDFIEIFGLPSESRTGRSRVEVQPFRFPGFVPGLKEKESFGQSLRRRLRENLFEDEFRRSLQKRLNQIR